MPSLKPGNAFSKRIIFAQQITFQTQLSLRKCIQKFNDVIDEQKMAILHLITCEMK